MIANLFNRSFRCNEIHSINNLYFFLQNGGAKDGLDMNLGPAWQKGYTGKGVVVSILDDGIQTNHPDLAQNYVSSMFFIYTRFSYLPHLLEILDLGT